MLRYRSGVLSEYQVWKTTHSWNQNVSWIRPLTPGEPFTLPIRNEKEKRNPLQKCPQFLLLSMSIHCLLDHDLPTPAQERLKSNEWELVPPLKTCFEKRRRNPLKLSRMSKKPAKAPVKIRFDG
ncbi:hypothetical protein WN48_02465 [Eufriesea mexicana]|nr:hypothetical protein WN48_02465 [Eufriesea mexicana]